MPAVHYEFRASEETCAECGAPMVTRVKLVDTAAGQGIERWRRDECPDALAHGPTLEPV